MNQNSFQKNGLLNVGNANSNSTFRQDHNQLGRRTIEDIKTDMLNAKQNKRNFKPEEPKTNNNSTNSNQYNMQNRIDYLKKIDNMNRWK